MSIDHTDDGQSQGVVDDPDGIPDDPGRCAKRLLARTSSPAPREDETGTTSQVAESRHKDNGPNETVDRPCGHDGRR